MTGAGQDGGGEAGFLSRWSRRKQQARDGRDEAVDPQGDDTVQPIGAEGAVEDQVDESTLSDEQLLARYELPDPQTLTATDDVAAFMRKGVPARLRNLALRRLWRLDPVLANLDGLNDYDDDYTDAATVVANLKTVYQVGKGGAAHLRDADERLAAAGGPEEPPQPEPVAPEPGASEPAAAATEAEADMAHEDEAHENVIDPADDEAASARRDHPSESAGEGRPASEAAPETPRRRRMVFSTDAADVPAGPRHFNK